VIIVRENEWLGGVKISMKQNIKQKISKGSVKITNSSSYIN
jgi:hypothetical protein